MAATDQRTALITGAASGIGKAAAEVLASRGFRLGLIDRDGEGLARISGLLGQRDIAAETCDVTDAAAVRRAVDAAQARLGGVDVVIASAGVARYGAFDEVTNEDWCRMFDVNVMGTVNVVRAILPAMRRRGRGLVVAVGSRRGLEPKATTAAYSASKAALRAALIALQAEHGAAGIDFSFLAPGGTRTGLDTPKSDRFMRPETVARAIAFICEAYPEGWVRQLELLPMDG